MKVIQIGDTHIAMGGNPSQDVVDAMTSAVLSKYRGGGNGGGGCTIKLDVVLYKNEICARVPEGNGIFKLVPLQIKRGENNA